MAEDCAACRGKGEVENPAHHRWALGLIEVIRRLPDVPDPRQVQRRAEAAHRPWPGGPSYVTCPACQGSGRRAPAGARPGGRQLSADGLDG